MSRIAPSLLAAVTATLLSGCATTSSATGDGSAPPAQSASAGPVTAASPSTSAVVGSMTASDRSFSAVRPPDWKGAPPPAKNVVYVTRAAGPSDAVVSNILVSVAAPATVPTLDDVVRQGEIDVRQAGATLSSVADRTIGGEPAKGYGSTRAKDGVQVHQVHYFVTHGDKVFTVVASSAAGQQQAMAATLESFLATWAWAH